MRGTRNRAKTKKTKKMSASMEKSTKEDKTQGKNASNTAADAETDRPAWTSYTTLAPPPPAVILLGRRIPATPGQEKEEQHALPLLHNTTNHALHPRPSRSHPNNTTTTGNSAASASTAVLHPTAPPPPPPPPPLPPRSASISSPASSPSAGPTSSAATSTRVSSPHARKLPAWVGGIFDRTGREEKRKKSKQQKRRVEKKKKKKTPCLKRRRFTSLTDIYVQPLHTTWQTCFTCGSGINSGILPPWWKRGKGGGEVNTHLLFFPCVFQAPTLCDDPKENYQGHAGYFMIMPRLLSIVDARAHGPICCRINPVRRLQSLAPLNSAL